MNGSSTVGVWSRWRPANRAGAGVHGGDGGLQHGGDRLGAGGIGAVGVEDGPAVGQLHQLGVSGQHPDQALLHEREHGPDQPPQQRRLPRPGRARDQHMGAVQPDQPGQAVLAAADRQGPQVGMRGNRERGDEGGQGITADELQHHRPGPGRPDPAQHRAEPVRKIIGVRGEVSGGLAGDQPDHHPVGVPGRGHLAEHGQQGPALIPRRYPGDRHHRGPPAAVAPAPPSAPGRAADPAGERDRPVPPPGPGDDEDGQDQGHQGDPAEPDPDHRGESQHARNQRVPGDHPGQPAEQPGELDGQDDADRGAVDRRPPAGHRERVRVVQLGQLLAGHDPAHKLITSFVHTGENPGAAGGTSSSRPALTWSAITPPARKADPSQPPQSGPWRRACSPAQPRTGSLPRPGGGRTSRRRR